MRPLESSDPAMIGPYRLIAELGRGGMGRVLLGSSADGRLIALKRIHAHLVDSPGLRERFRREVAVSRRVSGAYTAAVVDADPDAETPWLASVFVPGPALQEVLDATGPLPRDSVLRLAAGLAAALGEIHGTGLVHRDLKPSNVLLTDEGPRVIDFGIAVVAEGGGELTRSGDVLGSPWYMSPEQVTGASVGPASDMFSLGTVLVAAATGTCPFAGESPVQTMYNVVHSNPDLSALPPRLVPIVEQCLRKDPGARPTVARFIEAVGEMRPSRQPWPSSVRRLGAEQQAAISHLLDESPERATLIDTGLSSITMTRPGEPLASTPRATPSGLRRSLSVIGAVVGSAAIGVAGIVLVSTHGGHSAGASSPAADTTTPRQQASVGPASPTGGPTTPTVSVDPSTQYEIVNLNSGQCVDPPDYGTPSPGDAIDQYTCNGTSADNQLWNLVATRVVAGQQLYEISNVKGGLCLDLPGYGAVSAETHVSVYTCNTVPADDNQEWELQPVDAAADQFLVVNYKDGLCLDVSGDASDKSDLAAGTSLTVYYCRNAAWANNGYDDHVWQLVG